MSIIYAHINKPTMNHERVRFRIKTDRLVKIAKVNLKSCCPSGSFETYNRVTIEKREKFVCTKVWRDTASFDVFVGGLECVTGEPRRLKSPENLNVLTPFRFSCRDFVI